MQKVAPASALACLLSILGCSPATPPAPGQMQSTNIRNPVLDEISGIQRGTLNPKALFVHNDDGPPRVFVIDHAGEDLGSFLLEGARNRDWEDITAVPTPDGPLLVVADTGDNFAQWDSVTLYFLAEPAPGPDGRYQGTVPLVHSITLTYPDGARDCESLAYDSSSQRLLLISKRDTPPRIYGIDLATALAEDAAELQLLGDTVTFRPPTRRDLLIFGPRDGPWVSQPTGFDIAPDGKRAAVISYRSLYLWERAPSESWEAALARTPMEIEAPPSRKEEAVGIEPDGTIVVTAEGGPAPLYRISVTPESP
jgi:hypothetical protein